MLQRVVFGGQEPRVSITQELVSERDSRNAALEPDKRSCHSRVSFAQSLQPVSDL